MANTEKPRGASTAYAWGVNAIRFIDERGLTTEFNDWCGGWKCPVSPEQIAAAPELLEALKDVRDDLLMRAELDRGEKIVACGAGVWVRLNAALAKAGVA